MLEEMIMNVKLVNVYKSAEKLLFRENNKYLQIFQKL